MLRSYFRRMRMQPKEVRDKHALIIALTFTGIIAGVWLFTRIQFGTIEQQQVAAEAQPPFSGLLNQVKDQWAAVQETFSEIEDSTPEADPAPSVTEDSPTSFRLSEETLEQVRRESESATTWEMGGEIEAGGESQALEVQIVTVSSVSTSTASTTE